jgi:hypothetical protein
MRVLGAVVIHPIATRWTPERIVRRDTERGYFECVNPLPEADEIAIQGALLSKRAPRRVSWVVWWLLLFAIALHLAWAVKP